MAQTINGLSCKNGIVEFTDFKTTTSGVVNAAQKVIDLTTTTGLASGDTLEYMLVGGVIEQNVIDTVDSGIQVTALTNVGAGGIASGQQVNRIVNISGTANSVTVSGGNRMAGDGMTASGDTPLITYGKREPIEVTFRGVYTEPSGAPEFFEQLATVYESGAGCGLRWSPTAYDTAGQKRFWTTDTAATYIQIVPITTWNYPSLDFASGDPIMCELTVRTPAVGTTDHS